MIVNANKLLIKKLDNAIKLKVATSKDGIYDDDAYLCRIMWNILFNKNEKERCGFLLDKYIDNHVLKDKEELNGSMPE